jgi:hypothetical protein
MHNTEIVWMSLTIHPTIKGTSATMLVVDGGRRLAFRGMA